MLALQFRYVPSILAGARTHTDDGLGFIRSSRLLLGMFMTFPIVKVRQLAPGGGNNTDRGIPRLEYRISLDVALLLEGLPGLLLLVRFGFLDALLPLGLESLDGPLLFILFRRRIGFIDF
jgi:hypothetical protein